jgi:hypothetical protein
MFLTDLALIQMSCKDQHRYYQKGNQCPASPVNESPADGPSPPPENRHREVLGPSLQKDPVQMAIGGVQSAQSPTHGGGVCEIHLCLVEKVVPGAKTKRLVMFSTYICSDVVHWHCYTAAVTVHSLHIQDCYQSLSDALSFLVNWSCYVTDKGQRL